jgi:hypothetical protein
VPTPSPDRRVEVSRRHSVLRAGAIETKGSIARRTTPPWPKAKHSYANSRTAGALPRCSIGASWSACWLASQSRPSGVSYNYELPWERDKPRSPLGRTGSVCAVGRH